jgi:hypothetical protein
MHSGYYPTVPQSGVRKRKGSNRVIIRGKYVKGIYNDISLASHAILHYVLYVGTNDIKLLIFGKQDRIYHKKSNETLKICNRSGNT